MSKNKLIRLFEEFEDKNIKYCVRGRYKHLPEILEGGDVDLFIEKNDFDSFKKIIRSRGFRYYPFTEPNLFFYYYDKDLGLIQLDVLLVNNMVDVKKYNGFFIPKKQEDFSNKKSFLYRIYTGLRRRLYWLFKGPVIIFNGPDGSGKSTNLIKVYNALEKFGLKKEIIHFATHFKDNKKPGNLKRLYTRMISILKVIKNKVIGRVSLTDRYIYLTFRKHNPIFKKILRFLAPTPDLAFIMKLDYETIKNRKQGQRDLLNEEVVKELYRVYSQIPNRIEIDTTKPLKESTEKIVNLILDNILI